MLRSVYKIISLTEKLITSQNNLIMMVGLAILANIIMFIAVGLVIFDFTWRFWIPFIWIALKKR